MRPRPLPSAIVAFLAAVVTMGVATEAMADGSITATDDAYSTVHDQTLVVVAPGVMANDTDTFGNPQVALDQGVAHGTLTLGTDGSVSYTPNAGYAGPDSFTYHVTDVDGSNVPVSSNVATVAISVTNADPVSADDSYSVTQGQTLTKNATDGVLANDSDPDGDTLSADLLTDVSHGTLTLNGDGSFTYTPNTPFFGTDHFTYQTDDGVGGTSDPATVSITVNAAANSPPTAVDDSYSVPQAGTLTKNAATGVLSNDTDPDGDTLTADPLTGVAHGTLDLNADGSFTYTPNAAFFGADHFTYQADDGHGGTSDPATVTISVNATGNSSPTAVDDSYSVQQGGTLAKNAATGVLANDTDSDGDTLTADLLTDVSHGSLTLNPDGSFTYSPNASFFGEDHFTYQADDGHGGTSDPATVTISVNATGNSPPTAVDDSYSVTQGQTLTKNAATGVLANDTDPDGDTLSAGMLTDVSHGNLTFNSNGSFTYSPNAPFQGTDHFTYQASDSHGGTSDPATVTLTVNSASNSPPTAVADTYSTNQATELDVNAVNGVLSNDTDSDGDTLTAGKVTGTSHGTLTLHADGSFSYTPNASFFGEDHFTYQADDGHGGTSDPATVTISVNATGNSPPTAVDDSYSVTQGQTLTKNAATGVLANDTDPDGDTLTANLLIVVSHGTLTLNADGSFTYTPNAPFFGTDHFTYQADDGSGGTSDPTTVTITVNADRRPAAADDNYTPRPVTRGHQLSIAAPGVLANDTDPDGDPLTAHWAAEPARGTLTLNPNGSFTYLPNTGVCNASDTFTYRASDGTLASAPATVTVRIRTPLKSTQMRFGISDHAVRFGQFVTLTAHVRAFSPGAFVRFFVRRPGATPSLLGSRRPDPKTHVAKIRIQPARNAWYSAISDDNCFEAIRSGSHRVAVKAVGGGHMIGLRGRGAPTYMGYVHPRQPDGVVTFIWQQLSGRRWVHYLDGGVSLDSHGHVGVTLTSGVVRGVHYRVTLRWNGKGGNVPGHAPWTYFVG